MNRVLVTGATGFVGPVLCGELARRGYLVRAALRAARSLPLPDGVTETAIVGDIGSHTQWQDALLGVDAIVHIAARAHVLNDDPANADLYMETNAHGTRRLVSAAAAAGVSKFVYMSSIKVNGEETTGRAAYTCADEPKPRDAYGISKWMGETAVLEIAAQTGMHAAIVRSPLVYGPCVRANFLRLLRWVDKELPLPLGSVHNTRSLVSVWNLSDLLAQVLEHSAAAGQAWMVSDGDDLSTAQLIRLLGSAMHRRVRLLPVPVGVLRFGGRLIGRGAEVARLCGSLAVNITRTRAEIGWRPPVTVHEGLARTVRWYLSEGRLRG
jgi:nucleoside-diphosphate-sugar epimerase